MKRTNIMIVGGFFGSGKTTSIISLAKYYMGQEKSVGIILNDLGSSISDIEYMKLQGLNVVEVTGGSIGSNFNIFIEKIYEINKNQDLDFILVETVGSCTDIIATVIKPAVNGLRGYYRLLPLSVLLDSVRLYNEVITENKHFSKEQGYLICKQMEEADLIVVNKADLLSKAEMTKIEAYLISQYEDKKILFISGKKNIGIDSWVIETDTISNTYNMKRKQSLKIDYGIYSKGVSELGWLCLTGDMTFQRKISGNQFVNYLAESIKKRMIERKQEAAHLKINLSNSNGNSKINCTSVFEDNTMDSRMNTAIDSGFLVINIRACLTTEQLVEIVEASLNSVIKEFRAELDHKKVEAISPPSPRPTYRFS